MKAAEKLPYGPQGTTRVWIETRNYPFPVMTFRFKWNPQRGIVKVSNVAELNALQEGTIIEHEGHYAAVVEYALDDANWPLKNEPMFNSNAVFLLVPNEVKWLEETGNLLLELSGSEVQRDRFRLLSDSVSKVE